MYDVIIFDTHNIPMRTLIKEIINVNSEGVSFKLTEKASLTGGLSTDQWFVSWDKIGRALFKEQYSDAITVKDLRIERGENDE